MNVKRTLVVILAAGTMLLSMGSAASAAPNESAPCIALHHAAIDGGQSVVMLVENGQVVQHAQMRDCPHHA
jgi:hypothetical protein